MYGVDVMTLLSYDQVQFTDNNWSSITYATPVGLLFVQGEKNETRTMLDAAVYDIASRKMLFRAPGISSVKDSSTLLNQDLNLRKNSEDSYQQASTNLVTNLRAGLEEFKDRVKTQPEEYKVVSKPGYKMAMGALGEMDVLLVVVFGAGALWVRRERKV
jgi:rhombotail lipoprotein